MLEHEVNKVLVSSRKQVKRKVVSLLFYTHDTKKWSAKKSVNEHKSKPDRLFA